MNKGLTFDCADGIASYPADKVKIMAAIGAVEEQHQLNCSVHGRVAVASLRPALEQGGELAEQAIEAIKAGRLVRFELAMEGSEADTVQNVQSVVSALDPQTLESLALYSQCWKQADEWLAEALVGRVFVKLLQLELQSESLLDCSLWCDVVCAAAKLLLSTVALFSAADVCCCTDNWSWRGWDCRVGHSARSWQMPCVATSEHRGECR